MAIGSGYAWIEILQGQSSIDVKIGLSVAVLVLTGVIFRYIIPRLVKVTLRLSRQLMEVLGLGTALGIIFPEGSQRGFGIAIIRSMQLIFGGAVIILLLGIWGEIGPVIKLLSEMTIPVGLLVKAFLTVMLLVGAYVGMDLLHRWVTEITERSNRITQHQEEIWVRVIQIIFLIAAMIISLSLWGIDLGGLLVGAGFLGIVAGLAAQQTLGSLIAGFVLMLSRPFEIGDWVKIGDNEGIVTEITIVNTRLENFDGEIIALPNDSVANATIINRTMKGRLRLRVEVGIDYDADPEHASDVATKALREVDRVLNVPRPRVVTSRFGDSAIVLELRFWIDKPSARRRALAISDSIKAVSEAYQEAGIKIPFPQRELMGRDETGGFRVVDEGSENQE